MEDKILEAFELLSAAGMPDELMSRLMTDPEEVRQEERKAAEAEYQEHNEYIQTVEEIEPEFILETDQTFTFKIEIPKGIKLKGKVPEDRTANLRILQNTDFDRLIAQVPYIITYFRRRNINFLRGAKDAQQYVNKVSPMVFIEDLLKYGFADRYNGKPTQLNRWIYEESARLLTTKSNPITARYLISLDHYDQIIQAIVKLVGLNNRFLHRFLEILPSDLKTLLYTLYGKSSKMRVKWTQALEKIKVNFDKIEKDLDGGTKDGTGEDSSSPSQQKSDSSKPLEQLLLIPGNGSKDKQKTAKKKAIEHGTLEPAAK